MGRRRKGEPPAYRLHKASGLAYSEDQGKESYFGPYGSRESRQEYQRYIVAWERANKRHEISVKSSNTVMGLGRAFIGHAKAHYRFEDGTATDEVTQFNYT